MVSELPRRNLNPRSGKSALFRISGFEFNPNMNFLITAGPTREAIDPVRFISNRSSGKMGYALAAAAIEAGHRGHADQRTGLHRAAGRARIWSAGDDGGGDGGCGPNPHGYRLRRVHHVRGGGGFQTARGASGEDQEARWADAHRAGSDARHPRDRSSCRAIGASLSRGLRRSRKRSEENALKKLRGEAVRFPVRKRYYPHGYRV